MRWFFLLLACGLAVLGIAARLDELHARTDLAASNADAVPEDQALFEQLLAAGVLQPRADGGLERLPPDWALRRAAAGERADDVDERVLATRSRLLRELDRSAVGAIVRQQIELWNETRSLTAIRDDGVPGEEGTRFAWSARARGDRPLASGRLIPETFGFVHDGVLKPGFADWLAIPGSDDVVHFDSWVTPRDAGPVTIQLIGEPVGAPPGARLQRLEGDVQVGCPTQPVAYAITLPARGDAPFPVELTARPSVNCAARIHGLAIRLDEPAPDEAGEARYRFAPVRRARPSGRYVIRARDGEPLSDASGRGQPSALARSLGLVPLVGTGSGDSFSVSGMLGSTPLPLDGLEVSLTIDVALQAAAQEALDWGATRYSDDAFEAQRKAALVVLDADSGEILAVAGHPKIPTGLSDWDLPAFSAAFPLRDPATVFAWEVIDKHNTPGSTFKPVTALSLMLEDDPEFAQRIRPVLRGLSSDALQRATGLSFESRSYVAYAGAKPVPNFGGTTLGRYADRPRRDPRCLREEGTADAASEDGGFGLVEATQFSLNAWYARVALMMEQARIEDYARRVEAQEGDRIPAPEMGLTRTARRLGIDDRERLDLAANVPPAAGLKRHAGDAHDVLYPQLARSTLAGMAYNSNDWGARPLVMYTAALNGIGQTVSASPLHMALAAAAIATGNRTSPSIFAAWNGVPLDPPPGEALGVDPELLGLLRAGMKAVTEVGTAPRAFPRPLACRVYGKTGTAEIDGERAYNSGWFIGWREASEHDPRRLAFACMSTHATGNYRFGGTACAPIVSRALQAIEPVPEAERAVALAADRPSGVEFDAEPEAEGFVEAADADATSRSGEPGEPEIAPQPDAGAARSAAGDL